MSSDFTCGAFPACFTACFISVSADHVNASPSVRRLPAHAAATEESLHLPRNQLASWSSQRLLAGFEAPRSALGVTSSSDPEPTLPEE